MANFTAGTTLAAAALNSAFNQADINAQTGTTYTFVLSDQGKLVSLSNASAQTITIPAYATVPFPTGTVISLLSLGAGLVTVQGAGGVTLNPSSATLSQYEAASLVNLSSNSWVFVRGGFPKAVVSSSTAASTEAVTAGGKPATVYKFTGTGSITFAQGGLVDVLCVGPGGCAGDSGGGAAGAGGAGGYVIKENVYVPSGANTIFIGAGMGLNFGVVGNPQVSTFNGVTAVGGGNGGPYRDRMPSGGACGGGSSSFAVSTAQGSNYQGLIGGNLRGGNGANTGSGGGGGVAGDASGGSGGAGTTIPSDWGTGYGTVGQGGGGAAATANSGNGGNLSGGSGNSGRIIVRVYN